MRFLTFMLALMLSTASWALATSEYLPADTDPDPAVPTPESVLGWEVGDWRVSHDLLVKYMEAVAASSDRVSIRVIGRTYEQRPLLQLAFTSPQNQGRLEELRQQHLDSAHGALDENAPLVLWMGHSVHGNEASGSNAALLLVYYLAASRSGYVTSLLENSVILVDPSFNPDGLNRFASWSNANRSMNPVADYDHRINHESWPGARTNHYLFDLNRDWLPLVHPESRARIDQFHRWLPHVLTDQHERGRDGYFFQPGVPSRQNPLTPESNLELTRALAQYHAKAMDEAGEAYFTEDDYDDFYYGKGSTYPDINGSIGILFEQPNIKGPVRDRDTGRDTFVNAIRNQLRTSLSTIRGAAEIRVRLNRYQNDFFETMSKRAADADHAAWIIGDDGDPARARALLEVLDHHRIEYQPLAEPVQANSHSFSPGHAWVLPTRQTQFGLLQGVMETRTEFEDDTFYDVSAWTQPLAYNLPYAQLSRMPRTGQNESAAGTATLDRNAVAWIIPWKQMQAPALLQKLLSAGARVLAASKPFVASTRNGNRSFAEGTLVIHAGLQDPGMADTAYRLLLEASGSAIDVAVTDSALTPGGPDLGAMHFKTLKPVKPLMVVGDGTSSTDVGHAWHQFDQRLGVAPVMVEIDRLRNLRLDNYTHLIMVGGQYSAIGSSLKEGIALWVRDGGILISTGRASNWVESLCFDSSEDDCEAEKPAEDETKPQSRAYNQFNNDESQHIIGGAIVAATVDTSHPLAWGLSRPDLPLFRKGTAMLTPSDNAYSTPVRYTDDPLLAGFIGAEQQDKIRGQAAVIAERQGRGLVVRFANNPLFRGFWRGTERLFNNALYMGQAVESTEMPD